MKILCISDTHYKQNAISLTECDVVVFAGDYCTTGALFEFQKFVDWLETQSSKFKKAILVAGNHDWCLMNSKRFCVELLTRALGDKAIYLEDSECVIDGVKFYGSPWQPEFCNWAFNKPRGEDLKLVWSNIPDDVNVLITHGPPHGICDKTERHIHVGCTELLTRVKQLNGLFLHVFGHIHCANGVEYSDEVLGTHFCNAAVCDETYTPTNAAHEFTIHNKITHKYIEHKAVYLSNYHENKKD